MTRNYGSQSMVAPLLTVLVKRPEQAFAVSDPVDWHYTARPDVTIAQQEHDALVALLRQGSAKVVYHNKPQPESPPRKTTNFVLHAGRPAVCMPDGPCRLHAGRPVMRARYDVTSDGGGGLPIIRAPHHDRPLSVSDGRSLVFGLASCQPALAGMPDGPHLACRTARRLPSWRLS